MPPGPYDQEVADWKLLQADGNPGASTVAGRPPVSWSTGTKKVLMIRVDFSDLPGSPVTFNNTTVDQAYINGLFNNPNGIADFYAQGSYGLTSLALTTSDVTGVLRLPQTAAVLCRRPAPMARSTSMPRTPRPKPASTSRITTGSASSLPISAVCPTRRSITAGSARSRAAASGSMARPTFASPSHELGHTYGLMHCNLWQVTDGNPVSDTGTSTEYADPFGVMGSGNTDIRYQFDPWQKTILHWIPDTSVPGGQDLRHLPGFPFRSPEREHRE